MAVRKLTIRNERGLHARASGLFAEMVEQFSASARVSYEDMSVSGKSIMGLLTLSAGPGAEITVTTSGEDEEALLNALEKLVSGKFGEKR